MRIGPDGASPSVARCVGNHRSRGIPDAVAILFLATSSRLLKHLRPDYSIVWIALACPEEIS